MVRRKVKLAYIVNNADRLASYRKREKSFLNKADELSKLCGIDVFAIVYAKDNPQPTLYPAAPDKVQQLIARFRAIGPAEQRKRMENQEAYMGKTLTKAQAKMKSLQTDNREMELTQFVNECLEDRNKVDSLGQKDLLDMDSHIELKLKEINRRLELMKMQSPEGEEEKAPASAHEDN